MYIYLNVCKVEEMYTLLRDFRKIIQNSKVLDVGEGNLDHVIKIKDDGYSFCIDTSYHPHPYLANFKEDFLSEIKAIPFRYDIELNLLYRNKGFNLEKYEVVFTYRE